MKNNLSSVFHRYINHEIDKHETKILDNELVMANLFSMVYDMRYTEDFNVNRIIPKHMRDVKAYPKLYTKEEIDDLPISDNLKGYMKTIITYQLHNIALKHQVKSLSFYLSFSKSTYFAIMQVIWVNLAKIILNGFSLNLGFGLGTISLIWARPKDGKVVDWFKSMEKKQEIIERGGIPYYKYDEEVSISEGMEYRGEQWIIRKDCELKLYLKWSRHKRIFYEKVDYRTFRARVITTITSENRRVSDFFHKSSTYIMNTTKLDILRKAYVLMELDKTYYLKFRNVMEERELFLTKQNKVE